MSKKEVYQFSRTIVLLVSSWTVFILSEQYTQTIKPVWLSKDALSFIFMMFGFTSLVYALLSAVFCIDESIKEKI